MATTPQLENRALSLAKGFRSSMTGVPNAVAQVCAWAYAQEQFAESEDPSEWVQLQSDDELLESLAMEGAAELAVLDLDEGEEAEMLSAMVIFYKLLLAEWRSAARKTLPAAPDMAAE